MRVDVQFTGCGDAWLRNDHGKEAGANDIPDAAKSVCEGTIKHFFYTHSDHSTRATKRLVEGFQISRFQIMCS